MKKIILSAFAALFVFGTSMAGVIQNKPDSKKTTTTTTTTTPQTKPQTNPSKKKHVNVKTVPKVSKTTAPVSKKMAN